MVKIVEVIIIIKKKINNFIWDCTRFGVSPNKLFYRIFSRKQNPIIFSNSIPKAGTHLIERLLCLNPNYYRRLLKTLNEQNIIDYGGFKKIISSTRKNQLLIAHIHFNKDFYRILYENEVKHILTIRNPKDIIISRLHYLTKTKKHRYHFKINEFKNFEDKVRFCLYGDYKDSSHPFLSINDTFNQFINWGNYGALVIKFEDLIGNHGGGDLNRQKVTIKEIFNFLGMDLGDSQLSYLSSKIFFKSSPTFRKGKINSWKDNLNDDLIIEIEQSTKKLCNQLGY